MQWKTITNSLGNRAYGLWNNGRKLLTLAYRPQTNKVYIESEDGERRYFKYSNKGFFKRNIVLENEYGTGLGKLKKDKEREYILIDDKRYYLNFKNNTEVEIIEENKEKPLTVCSLDVENPGPKTKEGLLMVLCYYLLGHSEKYQQPFLAAV
ncbi:MAG: hypothetical protein QM640_14380 [Niabella sp.]